jgi:hypothetical protein
MKKKIFLLLAFSTFLSCKNDNPSHVQEQCIGEWEYKSHDTHKLNKIKWKCYLSDSVKVHIPHHWTPHSMNGSLLYVSLNKSDPKIFYSIIQYDAVAIGMNSESYIKEGFKQISDELDKFNYIIRRVDFGNKDYCYIVTYFTKENNKMYVTYNLIYNRKNKIYDFGYKVLYNADTNEFNYNTFLFVNLSFKFNGEEVFNKKDKFYQASNSLKIEDLN